MRCIQILIAAFLILPFFTLAQSRASIEQYHVVGNSQNYVPISIAHFQNNKKWCAEGRYNYEELKTFSFYVGKTFSKEKQLSYAVTPLLGGALGQFTGISTGLNLDVDYNRFFFSMQSQYAFSTNQRVDHFFYNWSELAYQPLDWMYGGFSIQQTRLYKTKSSFESGILVGFTFGKFTIPIYTFAPFNKKRYFMLGVTIEWEKSSEKRGEKIKLAKTRDE